MSRNKISFVHWRSLRNSWFIISKKCKLVQAHSKFGETMYMMSPSDFFGGDSSPHNPLPCDYCQTQTFLAISAPFPSNMLKGDFPATWFAAAYRGLLSYYVDSTVELE